MNAMDSKSDSVLIYHTKKVLLYTKTKHLGAPASEKRWAKCASLPKATDTSMKCRSRNRFELQDACQSSVRQWRDRQVQQGATPHLELRSILVYPSE